MKLLGIEEVIGQFIAITDYDHGGKNFPLGYLHILRTGDRELIKLLVDRERWREQGGNKLKTHANVLVVYGVYSQLVKGKEVVLHVFEDLYLNGGK